jgi:Zn-dependent protease with chaperone function
VDFAPAAEENKLVSGNKWGRFGFYEISPGFHSRSPSSGRSEKVYTMRSAFRFFTVAALALMLVSLGFSQNQTSAPPDPNATTSNAPSNATSNPPAQDTTAPAPPDKPDKNAPPPGSLNNIDAIGNRNVGCNKGLGNWYSLDKQVAMGRQYSEMVEHGAKMVSDPVVTEYINRLGQNLVRNSDAKVPFTIKVIDTDDINAFALPGGFFYVNSGLLLAADNEAELAGVMAHEIGHVAACHVAREQTRGNIVNLASIPLIFVPGGWAVYEGAQAAMGIGVPLAFMKFSRNFEAEADFLGMEYMYKAGYDPQSFISFFEKIEAQEKKKPGTLAKAFASHPMTPDRVASAQNEMKNVLPARPEYIVDTSEFEQVKGRLASLENRHKLQNDKDNKDRPTLRRATADNPSTNGSGSGSSGTQNDDDRPTLKRSDGSGSGSGSSFK